MPQKVLGLLVLLLNVLNAGNSPEKKPKSEKIFYIIIGLCAIALTAVVVVYFYCSPKKNGFEAESQEGTREVVIKQKAPAIEIMVEETD